ncbi:hypothetical protein ABPG74_008398 [Tetrahymena malaccensis]
MSESEVQDKKGKKKKQQPRFTSVKKEEFDQFLKDVNEYKQILKSIGMYDLCQNWKQKRNMERNEQKKERLKLKIKKQKEKELIGDTYYKLQKNSEMLFEALGEHDNQTVDEQDQSEQLEVPTYYQEYNKAYQNQQTLSEMEEEELQQQASIQLQNEDDSKRNKSLQSDQRLLQDEILNDNTQSFQKAGDEEDDLDKINNSRNYNKNEKSLNQDSIEKKRQQSKKKANLISKSLKKHQFRSQENSEVGDIEHLQSEQYQALQDINGYIKPKQNNIRTNLRQTQNSYSDSNDDENQKEKQKNLRQQIHIRSDDESVVRETDNEQFQDQFVYNTNPSMDIEIMYQSSSNKQSQTQSNDHLPQQNYKFPPENIKSKASSQKNNNSNKKSQNKYSEEDISSESYNQYVQSKNYSQIQKQKPINRFDYSDDIQNISQDSAVVLKSQKSQNQQEILEHKESTNLKKQVEKQQPNNNYIESSEDDYDNLMQLGNSDQQTSSYVYIQDSNKNNENKKQNKSNKTVKNKKIKKKK